MRVALLSALAVMATLSAPAFAGSDSTDLPNPFTEPANPSAGLSRTARAAGPESPPSGPTQPVQPGDCGRTANDPGAAASSGSFYQASKKDTDGK